MHVSLGLAGWAVAAPRCQRERFNVSELQLARERENRERERHN